MTLSISPLIEPPIDVEKRRIEPLVYQDLLIREADYEIATLRKTIESLLVSVRKRRALTRYYGCIGIFNGHKPLKM